MIGIGSTVGNYEVIAKIGSGAMGAVFLAEHPSIGKRVALKVIHSDLAANAEMVSRFFTEARAITQIQNEHIIDVQNYGQTPDGDNFIVMEFLDGRGLGALLKEQPFLEVKDALHIAWQVADGLAASHERGIVHRDLKPDNVFLVTRQNDPLFVKILDFGLAKLTQGGGALSHKTRAGSVLGTPHYMAPEQCEGKADIDQRVDVYALGCILYEMLCGRVPFPGEGFGEVLVKHLREPPQLPTRINPHLPKSVERIILHALAKKREFRFRGMTEFAEALADPERYAALLEGNRPRSGNTLELLAQSPSIRAEQATQLLDAPLPPSLPPPEAKDTMLMEAPVLPDDAPSLPRMPILQPPKRRVAAASARAEFAYADELPARSSSATIVVVAIAAGVVLACVATGAWLLANRKTGVDATVLVATDPSGAELFREGKSLGRTPFVLHLAAGGSAEIVLKKEGFLDASRRVAAEGEPALVFKLAARVAAPDPAPSAAAEDPPPKSKAIAPKTLRTDRGGTDRPEPKRASRPAARRPKPSPAEYDDVMVPSF